MKYKYKIVYRFIPETWDLIHFEFMNELKRFGAKGYKIIGIIRNGSSVEYLLMKKYKDKKHPLKKKS